MGEIAMTIFALFIGSLVGIVGLLILLMAIEFFQKDD
jgi:hypothetical protein